MVTGTSEVGQERSINACKRVKRQAANNLKTRETVQSQTIIQQRKIIMLRYVSRDKTRLRDESVCDRGLSGPIKASGELAIKVR